MLKRSNFTIHSSRRKYKKGGLIRGGMEFLLSFMSCYWTKVNFGVISGAG